MCSFSRFKQKAWHFGTITTANLKSSLSSNGGLAEFGLDNASGRKAGSRSPKHERKVKSAYRSEILDALQSEVDMDLARHTINEAKLAKLHSIFNVLRETEDGGGSSDGEIIERQPKRPEFLSVFDPDNGTDSTKTLPSSVRKRKKRNRLSKAVLRVLREDSADDLSSDSGDNLDDGPPPTTLNRRSIAWLQSRKQDHEHNNLDGRPKSDTFQAIPRLRESLNAGKINKVSTYAFDDRSPKMNRKTGQTHNLEQHSRMSSEGSNIVPRHKVVDTRSQAEEESPSQQDVKFSSPVCKHYSVPVEISVHRISVKDVDEPPEIEPSRTKSFDVSMKGKKAEELVIFQQKMLAPQTKPRSRSLGDADALESDDEVLLVRTPVTNLSPAESPAMTRRSLVQVPNSPEEKELEVTSLDFTSAAIRRHSRSFVATAGRDDDDEIDGTRTQPRRKKRNKVRRHSTILLSKSLDNLVETESKPKSK